MGQQQLLLLVLGIVIVGLAVVVGIQAFTENQRKSEVDRYTEMGIAMAGDVIAYYHKPTAQGGAGQQPAPLGRLTANDLGYREDVSDTWNGFDRSGIIENRVVRYVAADPAHPFVQIHEWPLSTGGTRVEVHAFGPSQNCIVTRTDVYEVSETWSDGKAGDVAPDNPDPAGCSW